MSVATPKSRTAVLVLGMHRSGTSAVAGSVHLLGAAVPKTLMPGNDTNPRGFWESDRIVPIHEEMLEAMGSSWDDWRKADSEWLDSDAAAAFADRLREATIDEFGDAPLFVLKDPRMCRFLPLWIRVLEGLDIRPVAFHVVRNPIEVADSLKQRDGFVLEDAVLQWLRHVLDAEVDSRAMPRCFLDFESFLSDWGPLLDNAQKQTGIEWPRTPAAARRDIAEFLTDTLRRHRAAAADVETDPRLAGWAREACAHLRTLSVRPDDAGAMAALDQLRGRFDDACSAFGRQVERLRTTIGLLDADRAALATRVNQLEASLRTTAAAGIRAQTQMEVGAIGLSDDDSRAVIASEFDVPFYLASNPDVASAGVDPIDHFIRDGWREGRDPSPGFSTKHYLDSNADVRQAGMNPFLHFLKHGRSEGRRPNRK